MLSKAAILLGFASTIVSTAPLFADVFGSGANSFEIEFVKIGAPGNPPDTLGGTTPGVGSVPYIFRMGKYEITRDMIEKANAMGGLGITLHDMTNLGGNDRDKPATGISWFEAARFVSWLNTSTGHTPAYKFDVQGEFQLWESSDPGYDPNNLYRNRLARYFLPSFDEWHKAAYFDPSTGGYFDYPTGSDTPPIPVASGTDAGTAVYDQDFNSGPSLFTEVGGRSPFGTTGQGGNVAEWNETQFDFMNDTISLGRRIRGGAWASTTSSFLSSSQSFDVSPNSEDWGLGLRVSNIPEPNTTLLLTIAAAIIATFHRHMDRP